MYSYSAPGGVSCKAWQAPTPDRIVDETIPCCRIGFTHDLAPSPNAGLVLWLQLQHQPNAPPWLQAHDIPQLIVASCDGSNPGCTTGEMNQTSPFACGSHGSCPTEYEFEPHEQRSGQHECNNPTHKSFVLHVFREKM